MAKPLTFSLTETFAAPPDAVFAALHPDLFGQWMPNFVRIEWVQNNGLAPGSVFRETRKMFGREATEEFEIREITPGQYLRLYVDGTKGSSRKGYYDFRYTFRPTAAGTEMSLEGEVGGMSGFGAFIAKLFMKGMFRKAIAKDHAALRAYVERGQDGK